jgi:hypothetical protein
MDHPPLAAERPEVLAPVDIIRPVEQADYTKAGHSSLCQAPLAVVARRRLVRLLPTWVLPVVSGAVRRRNAVQTQAGHTGN